MTENLYKFRTEILQQICKSRVECDNNLTLVEGICNMEHIFKKLVFDIFQSTLTTTCILCQNVNVRKFGYIPCDRDKLNNKGIASLAECIDSKLEEIFTNKCKCSAEGHRRIDLNISELIFIDLEKNTFRNEEHEEQKYSIREIPKSLFIQGTFFNLKGIVEFISSDNVNSGHYISHSLRHSSIWQQYDDLKKLPSKTNTRKEMIVHTIIYLKHIIDCQ